MFLMGVLFILLLSVLFYKKLNFPISVSFIFSIVLSFMIFFLFVFMLIAGIKITLITLLILGSIALYLYNKEIINWKQNEVNINSTMEFSENITRFAISSDKIGESIPFNRVEYFNMDSKNNISDDVYPIIYNANPAKNEMKFMEYGYLVNTNEIVINNQIKNKKDKKEIFSNEKIVIPFQDLFKVVRIGQVSIIFYYKKRPLIVKQLQDNLSLIVNYVIDSGWSKVVNNILLEKSFNESEEQDLQQIEHLEKIFEKNFEELKINGKVNNAINSQFGSMTISMMDDLNNSQINARFSETLYKKNDKFTGDYVKAKGHGVAGEHAGNAFDKIKFKNAKGLGHDNSKDGADRVVNGKLIQTKYCKSAKDSINSVFRTVDKKQTAKYIYKLGNKQRMMIIEVPKDQYDEALKEMARKIKGGAVPNESDPNNSKKYVKKGALTYNQAQIAQTSIFDSKAHSQYVNSKGEKQVATFTQKLKYSAGIDFIDGAGSAIPGSIISSVWVYWLCRTNGQDVKNSFKNASIAFLKPVTYSGFTYMLAAQFAGSQVGKKIGQAVINTKIASKYVKNTQKNATKFVSGGTIVVLNAALSFGPDVYDVLKGRISHKQLVKNTVTTSVGMAGGMIVGTLFNPGLGSIIGATIGGTISSYTAKKIADILLEDDAVEMIKIAKEEFIEIVIMSGVEREEFEYILKETFLHKNFNKLLKIMFASENPRNFIRDIYNELLIKVYKERNAPDDNEIIAFIESIYYENGKVS
ncbi:hypothetical protein [Staphylococcus sp. GDH8C126P]|uniref:hypothetical protein n=1 Tax=Staphylococcus sp. GDH8C126P TaxID=2804089 RepID=UPI001AEC307A|nr:hypothetical protein [Staphylococcus sp. GDH8C126P]